MPDGRIRNYALVAIVAAFVAATGCGDDNGRSLLVTVRDGANTVLPGVTVVLGDSDGTLTAYGTTDSNGQIAFSGAPANATVTAAMSCMYSGSTFTTYTLDIRYDVNKKVTLRADGCRTYLVPPPVSTDLGTLTLNVTNGISGITQHEVYTNQPLFLRPSGLITQERIVITPYDLQSDGRLSLFVIGTDANGSSIGYGSVLDQNFTDGMTVNITVDKPLNRMNYQITNIPSTSDFVCPSVYQGRTEKGGLWLGDCRSLVSGQTSTIVTVPHIPGFGDQFLYSVSMSASRDNGTAYGQAYRFLGTKPASWILSDQHFDMSLSLAEPNVLLEGAGTPRPKLSWQVAPEATTQRVFTNFQLTGAGSYTFSVHDLRLSRTSIAFPELPDSLAAFRPVAVYYFSVDTAASDEWLFRASGESYFF